MQGALLLLCITAGFLILGLLTFANFVLAARLPPRKHGRFFDYKVFKELPYTLFVLAAFFVLWGALFKS
jgi:hypothetical protein